MQKSGSRVVKSKKVTVLLIRIGALPGVYPTITVLTIVSSSRRNRVPTVGNPLQQTKYHKQRHSAVWISGWLSWRARTSLKRRSKLSQGVYFNFNINLRVWQSVSKTASNTSLFVTTITPTIRKTFIETTQTKIINDRALVMETLHFVGGSNQSQANTIAGAGTMSRFIHGMDKRSMVASFEAKVQGENNFQF